MMLIFTFTVNPETKEAIFAGNIDIQVALQILQQLTLAEMIRRSKEDNTGGAIKEAEVAKLGKK